MAENQRNYGIDALKSLAMFMVVILHLLGHGGLLGAAADNSFNGQVLWLIEIGAYGAVNIFAITTGYLMVNHKFRADRIINMWLQVIFYALIINLIFAIVLPGSVGTKQWIKSLCPVFSNLWWYFSCYIVLSLFIPFINIMLNAIKKRQTIVLIAIIFIVFSTIPTLIPVDSTGINGGYSVMWLACMYIIGAVIKKYDFGDKYKKRWCLLTYAVLVFAVWISRIVIAFITKMVFGREILVNVFVNYLSPFVVISSISLLLFFKKIQFSQVLCKILKFISPLSFAVYIIHEHPMIREHLISDKFARFASANILVILGVVFGAAIAIFTVCILIEYLRTLLFKYTRISSAVKKAGNSIDNIISFDK